MSEPYNKGKGKAVKFLRDNAGYEGTACLIWPFGRQDGGYGTLGYLGKAHYAHRFMCELANGPSPSPEHEAAHSCGNGHNACVHPKHLSWKLPTGNQKDSVVHGTHYHPKPGRRWRLTEAQVAEIKSLRGKLTLAAIAARFDVTPQTIWKIHKGETWKTGKKVVGGFDRTPWTNERRRQYGLRPRSNHPSLQFQLAAMTSQKGTDMRRTPGQILGNDRMLQLIFEGYAVVPMKPTDAIRDWMAHTADGPGRSYEEYYSMLMNFASGATAETE